MPFGLCNAPATYSRLVQKVLEDIPTSMALPYLDDTCIHSKTFDEHVDILDTVFEAHCKAGLTLQPDKCQLFRPSIEYLGHVISAKGISPLPSHLDAVKNWEFPSTITQMRAFLGKVNYYRKFIPQYSSMAGVLSETIKGAPKKNQSITPTTKMTEAFQKLKQALLEAPILAYPTPTSHLSLTQIGPRIITASGLSYRKSKKEWNLSLIHI